MDDETVDVLVETPKGSGVKFEWDPERHGLRLDRRLGSATVFPTDYGWIDGTRSSDGETLDALVLGDDPLFPGCWVRARPIGVFWMSDEKGPDAKVLTVPSTDPRWAAIAEIADLPAHVLDEIAHFFDVYKALEPDKGTDISDWQGRADAERAITEAQARYRPEGDDA